MPEGISQNRIFQLLTAIKPTRLRHRTAFDNTRDVGTNYTMVKKMEIGMGQAGKETILGLAEKETESELEN